MSTLFSYISSTPTPITRCRDSSSKSRSPSLYSPVTPKRVSSTRVVPSPTFVLHKVSKNSLKRVTFMSPKTPAFAPVLNMNSRYNHSSLITPTNQIISMSHSYAPVTPMLPPPIPVRSKRTNIPVFTKLDAFTSSPASSKLISSESNHFSRPSKRKSDALNDDHLFSNITTTTTTTITSSNHTSVKRRRFSLHNSLPNPIVATPIHNSNHSNSNSNSSATQSPLHHRRISSNGSITKRPSIGPKCTIRRLSGPFSRRARRSNILKTPPSFCPKVGPTPPALLITQPILQSIGNRAALTRAGSRVSLTRRPKVKYYANDRFIPAYNSDRMVKLRTTSFISQLNPTLLKNPLVNNNNNNVILPEVNSDDIDAGPKQAGAVFRVIHSKSLLTATYSHMKGTMNSPLPPLSTIMSAGSAYTANGCNVFSPRGIPLEPVGQWGRGQAVMPNLQLTNNFFHSLVDWIPQPKGYTNESQPRGIIILGHGSSISMLNPITLDSPELQWVQTPISDDNINVTIVRGARHAPWVAVGDTSGHVLLVDLNTLEIVCKFDVIGALNLHLYKPNANIEISSMAWNPVVPGLLAVSTTNGDFVILEIHMLNDGCVTSKPISIIRNAHGDNLCGLAWNCNGIYLATGAADSTVCVWDMRHVLPGRIPVPGDGLTNCIAQLSLKNTLAKALAWCPWSPNLLAIGGGISDGTVTLWDPITNHIYHRIGAQGQVTSLYWSTKYRELVAAVGFIESKPDHPRSHQPGFKVWSLPHDLALVGVVPMLDTIDDDDAGARPISVRPVHVAYSPCGEATVTIDSAGRLIFWRLFDDHNMVAKKRDPDSDSFIAVHVDLRKNNTCDDNDDMYTPLWPKNDYINHLTSPSTISTTTNYNCYNNYIKNNNNHNHNNYITTTTTNNYNNNYNNAHHSSYSSLNSTSSFSSFTSRIIPSNSYLTSRYNMSSYRNIHNSSYLPFR